MVTAAHFGFAALAKKKTAPKDTKPSSGPVSGAAEPSERGTDTRYSSSDRSRAKLGQGARWSQQVFKLWKMPMEKRRTSASRRNSPSTLPAAPTSQRALNGYFVSGAVNFA